MEIRPTFPASIPSARWTGEAWGYTEEQYRDGLLKTVAGLTENSNGAKIIWTTTTPVREKSDLNTFSKQTDRVTERNRLAAEIVKEQGIATDDLFELVKGHPEWQSSDGVHFNGSGNEAMAKQVAERVLEVLPQGGQQAFGRQPY